MGEDYFGFSFLRNVQNNGTIAINNAADISVIVIYFLVVLAVGVWVSGQFFLCTCKTFLSFSKTCELLTLRQHVKAQKLCGITFVREAL